jgi:nucleotide-binding universal stress UspA family protein
MQTTIERGDGTRELDAVIDFRRILVPVDFAECSRRALATALELQRRFGSEICIFHLAQQGGADEFIGGLGNPTLPADLVTQTEDRLRRFVDNVFPGQASLVSCRAQVGADLVHAIDRIAGQWNATLVILGGHPHQGVFRTLTEQIIQQLDTPVMVLRRTSESVH